MEKEYQIVTKNIPDKNLQKLKHIRQLIQKNMLIGLMLPQKTMTNHFSNVLIAVTRADNGIITLIIALTVVTK